jgi:hypothetical protein
MRQATTRKDEVVTLGVGLGLDLGLGKTAGSVVPTLPGVLVSGAGTAAANGNYSYRGMTDQGNGLEPYYNKAGQPSDPLTSSIADLGIADPGTFYLTDDAGAVIYSTSTMGSAFPWEGTWNPGWLEQFMNTINVPTTITGSGNCTATVSAVGFNGNVPLVVPFFVSNGQTASSVALACKNALNANGTFAAFFTINYGGPDVEVTFKTVAVNDLTASLVVAETTATGLTTSYSAITTPGNPAPTVTQVP